jgi:hypothetical protein
MIGYKFTHRIEISVLTGKSEGRSPQKEEFMKRQISTILAFMTLSTQAFAADCSLMTFAGQASQTTKLVVKSNDPWGAVYSATDGSITGSLSLMTIPADSNAAPIGHMEATIYVNGKSAARLISDSMKPGQSFVVDAPDARLFCTL